MPEKILRLGYTETTLLFIYWMNNIKKENNENLVESKNTLIKWLYTTSGYYDKTIKSDFMNATHGKEDPEIYVKYMNLLLEFIKNSDISSLALHNLNENNKQYYAEFKQSFNLKKDTFINNEIIYKFIENKKILIISPFANLIKKQITSGNVAKIYPNMTDVNDIYAYEMIYTFFNNGPQTNIFETLDYIFTDINNKITDDYESVLISCGAYSVLFANKFYELGKNVCTIGGDLQTFFGILNKRTIDYYNKNNIDIKNKEYWITEIPDEYKPNGYEKIEGGCYW